MGLYVAPQEISAFKKRMKNTAAAAEMEAEKIRAAKKILIEKFCCAIAAICICTHIPPNDSRNAAAGKSSGCIGGSVIILLISSKVKIILSAVLCGRLNIPEV